MDGLYFTAQINTMLIEALKAKYALYSTSELEMYTAVIILSFAGDCPLGYTDG